MAEVLAGLTPDRVGKAIVRSAMARCSSWRPDCHGGDLGRLLDGRITPRSQPGHDDGWGGGDGPCVRVPRYADAESRRLGRRGILPQTPLTLCGLR